MAGFALRALLAAAALVFVPCIVFAQKPAPAGEQRVALVIGNSAYQAAPLSNPGYDAEDVSKALQELGFKVIVRRNVDRNAMRNAIREFGEELKRAQVGLFYYSGHGVQLKGNNYLIPVKEDIRTETDAEDLAVPTQFVLGAMEEAGAKINIVILDACRDNPYMRTFRSAGKGLAQMSPAAGTLIAFSTAAGSVADDGSGRNGLYTRHLLANLRQGDSEIVAVLRRTRAAVVGETKGRQTPVEFNALVGEFRFRSDVTVTATAPATIIAPGAGAGGRAALEKDLVSHWLVTVQGNSRLSTFRILSLGQRTSETFLVDATYGWIDDQQFPVRAELSRVSNERKLQFTTSAASVIEVTQGSDGSFTGSFIPKNGATRPVKLERISEQDLQSRLKVILAAKENQSFADEDKDWGVEPISRLRQAPYHAPTPTTIPGARVVKTMEVKRVIDTDKTVVVIDVLDTAERNTIPGAYWIVGAGAGQFHGGEKARFAATLEKLTAGDKNRPLVFLCIGAECWLSYNASLSAVEAGYRNVMWYRGGTNSWSAAKLSRRAPERLNW